MKVSKLAIAAFALVASAPLAASAQAWGWGGGRGDYYEGRQGGWRYGFDGYPEFRGQAEHVHAEIEEGLREGWLDPSEAWRLEADLQRVRAREAQEFREHGWNLPFWDRQDIRRRLAGLDQRLDWRRDHDRDRDRDRRGDGWWER